MTEAISELTLRQLTWNLTRGQGDARRRETSAAVGFERERERRRGRAGVRRRLVHELGIRSRTWASLSGAGHVVFSRRANR